ncbi:MAG: transporter substrate-binding domain-containing protein [Alphaproteobacteria bacterium]|nr:transporter substrate-binding domain-containing protein [Alphaproteobacteria bacterium]
MPQKISMLALALAVIALAFSLYTAKTRQAGAAAQESAFARVKRTGVLRCAYYVFPPATYRDPNTKALSGLSVDMMERIAKDGSLKIEWTEEINFGSWQPGLMAKRFDAVCTPMWPDAAHAREALFTRPMFYAGINVYARAGDHRFDNNLAAINDPGVTIAVGESEPTVTMAQDHFPKAKVLALPQNAAAGSAAQSVLARKADVFFWDENGIREFFKANPGTLHNVDPNHPVKVMPFELMVGLGEDDLRDFLDIGLQALEDAGITNQLLDKWEAAPGIFYHMAKPYVLPPQ